MEFVSADLEEDIISRIFRIYNAARVRLSLYFFPSVISLWCILSIFFVTSGTFYIFNGINWITKTSNLFRACTPHTSHSEASLSARAAHTALVLDSGACRQLGKMFIKVEQVLLSSPHPEPTGGASERTRFPLMKCSYTRAQIVP